VPKAHRELIHPSNHVEKRSLSISIAFPKLVFGNLAIDCFAKRLKVRIFSARPILCFPAHSWHWFNLKIVENRESRIGTVDV
jgi:hypothetical protein